MVSSKGTDPFPGQEEGGGDFPHPVRFGGGEDLEGLVVVEHVGRFLLWSGQTSLTPSRAEKRAAFVVDSLDPSRVSAIVGG